MTFNGYVPGYPAEPLRYYGEEHGLCPIYLDQVLHQRYRIVNKIGFGGFSVIWVAQDILNDDTLVSLKVIGSKSPQGDTERQILQLIKEDKEPHPGRQYLPRLLDSFYLTVQQRTNQVLVLELLGPRVSDVLGALPKGRRLSQSPAACRQILLAVDYLHSRGIVHGDIHDGNVLYALSDEFKFKDIAKNADQADVKWDGKSPQDEMIPKYLVIPYEYDWQLRNETDKSKLGVFKQVKLIDFSSSFFANNPPKSLTCVYHSTPPEDIFQHTLTAKVDIWSLACITSIHL